MVKKKTSWAKQAGVTPGKLVLIAVLAAVLGGVLYVQFAPPATSSPPSPPPPAPRTAAARRLAPIQNIAKALISASQKPTQRKRTGEVSSWQSPELEPIVVYDPFALPSAFPKPAEIDAQVASTQATSAEEASAQQAALEAERTKSESELAGLRQQGVAVIIKKKQTYVAIVGDQEVHVGDQINGFTVIAIDVDGVRVAKDLSP